MERLIQREYWNTIYKDRKPNEYKNKPNFLRRKIAMSLRKVWKGNYSSYLFWNVICNKYMPRAELKILEIGSAPGTKLIKFHQLFGYIPYGVDYSEEGIRLNRQLFLNHYIPLDNLIYEDFLSHDFQAQYKEVFDIVVSRGVIEHFRNPKVAIEGHINLLKRGGYLLIIIPNIRGINYFLFSFFNRNFIKHHNLNIMDKHSFSLLFDNKKLQVMYCDYYGTFNFGLFNTKNLYKISILKSCHYIQILLDIIFYLLFRDKGFEHPLFSPYLIFIGRKI